MGDHSSRRRIAPSLKQPTRTASGGTSPPSLFGLAPGGVYRAGRRYRDRGGLLPHPFTVTPPKICGPKPGATCFLLHFPWGRPRRALPGTVVPWSPDFPPAFAEASAGKPAKVPRRPVAARPSGRAYVEGA